MSLRTVAYTAAFAAMLGAAGCAPGLNAAFGGGDLDPLGDTTLNVFNNNWSDMTIYVERSGVRSRIGRVSGMSQETFKVPPALTGGDVRIVARPLGAGDSYVSQPLLMQNGRLVELRLENNLRLSNFAIW
jgi:hypothetical protein